MKNSPRPSRQTAVFPALLTMTAALLLLSMVIALSFGPSRLPARPVPEVRLYRLTGISFENSNLL